MSRMRWPVALAAVLLITASPLASTVALALDLPNLEELEPVFKAGKWFDKSGNDITKLMEGVEDVVPKGAPVTAPHYDLPTAPLEPSAVSPHDLPDVPDNLKNLPSYEPPSAPLDAGGGNDLPRYDAPEAPLEPSQVSPHDLPDVPTNPPGQASGYDKLQPPDYTTPEPPAYVTPEPPAGARYTEGPAAKDEPHYTEGPPLNDEPRYTEAPPEAPVADAEKPKQKPSFFQKNKKAIIKGAVMLGVMTVLMGTSLTVSQLSTDGIIH